VIRPLDSSDVGAAAHLLALRPLHNLFLDHLVRAGALGSVRGFFGCFLRGRLQGLLLVGPGGATALAVRTAEAHEPLADAAARSPTAPRHIVGPEDTTLPFWRAFAPHAAPVIWERREPVYLLTALDLDRRLDAPLAPAAARDLDVLVENSAQQYREDLGQDRYAEDPHGFRERHRREMAEGRWWVTRENGRIAFQVHVGAENSSAVQIGGVFVPSDLRGLGHALRGVAGISRRLLEGRRAVTLYCDEANAVARHVYERVGFRSVFWQRSWLLSSEHRSTYL